MRIIRFLNDPHSPVLAAVTDDRRIYPLPYTDFLELVRTAERRGETPLMLLRQVLSSLEPLKRSFEELALLVPIEAPEVWACGVTYERSRQARQEEADDGGDVYLRVYSAPRPELFFKARGEWVVGTYGEVGIRSDATWNVPEPELALVMNPALEIVGMTAANDMSSRDIEGENPLYLPQAKIYTAACALGHGIRLQAIDDLPHVPIRLEIQRGNDVVFCGETDTRNIRRRARDLLTYLGHSLTFPDGVVLLTGTGIVPPNDFTLHAGDRVSITIGDVDTLVNTVKVV